MPTQDSQNQELRPGRLQARLNFTRTTGDELLRLAVDEHDGLFLCRELSLAQMVGKYTQHQKGRWRTHDGARQWLAGRYSDYLQAGWSLIFMCQTRNADVDLLAGPWFHRPESGGEAVLPQPHLGSAGGEITSYADSGTGIITITTNQPHADDTNHMFETMRFAGSREEASLVIHEIADCWGDLEARELPQADEVGLITDTPALKAYIASATA